MAAPGVVVTTTVRSGPTGTPRAESGQYFVVGLAERGPTDVAVKINSMGDYRRIFGDRVSYGALYDDLTLFFEAGGQQAHVLRVVGAAATKGFVQLEAATPTPVARVEAANAGAWSSRLGFVVTAGGVAGTVKAQVTLDGDVVEEYTNVSSVAQLVARFSASPYVRVTSLGAAENLMPKPIVAVVTAGADDRATVTAARLTAQLPLLKIGLGDGAVAAPGFGTSMHAALIAHAKENRRIALLAGARGTTAVDLAALGLTLSNDGEFAGLFGPHLTVSDGAGGTRVVSPEGFVAAARANAHESVGAWSSAAGEGSVSSYVLGVDQEFSRADAELLDAGRVSPIRLVSGRIRLYGWRSLSADEAEYSLLSVQDLLNRLEVECETRLEPYVHKTINGRGQLQSQMAGILIGIMEPIRLAGGIFERIDETTGDVIDPGYSVNVGPNLNSVASLSRNEINALVAVRPSPTASLINLAIVKVGLAAAV